MLEISVRLLFSFERGRVKIVLRRRKEVVETLRP
jgi:hypothetical protein